MKKLVLFLMMLTVVSFSFAQEAVSITDPDPTVIGADSARQIRLRTKPSTGQWFLWEQFLLSDIRVPVSADPWA